ncbi:MAG: TfoX/Sxy family protein [Parvibaculum sp.]|uniref:TfoX/Sxy family protein n=1 Tax=Parvibaculum sp. TaxID=2024848 RepID=UPI003297ECDF
MRCRTARTAWDCPIPQHVWRCGCLLDDLMFCLIAGETLYFKADGCNRPDFEAEERRSFLYEPPSGKTFAMSYYELPECL